MASELQRAVPECRDPLVSVSAQPHSGAGGAPGAGGVLGVPASRAAPSSPARSPPAGTRWGAGGLVGHWGGSSCPTATGGSPAAPRAWPARAAAPASRPPGPSCEATGVAQVGPCPAGSSWRPSGTLFRVGRPSPSSPSPLTGAGLASGPRGCAGTAPQPSGPPGPAAAPGSALRGGEGGRARRRAAPNPPRPCWAAAGPAPGGAWPWGGSAWPWSPAGR